MARKRQNLQADKMLEQSNKRFKPDEEGENVNVAIPEVHRGRLDPPNCTAVIQEHDSETGLYTLGTKAGTLNTRFSRNQFNLMNQKFLTTADVPEDVTLCERSCSSPQQHGRTRIFQVPLPNYLSNKKMQMHQELCQVNSRCHKNRRMPES